MLRPSPLYFPPLASGKKQVIPAVPVQHVGQISPNPPRACENRKPNLPKLCGRYRYGSTEQKSTGYTILMHMCRLHGLCSMRYLSFPAFLRHALQSLSITHIQLKYSEERPDQERSRHLRLLRYSSYRGGNPSSSTTPLRPTASP